MTNQDIKKIWYEQLACDYSCTTDEIKSTSPVFAKKAYHPKRRIFRGDDCFLKILIVNGKLVVNAEDEAFLTENRSFFENASAAWFFEPDNIRSLDKLLAKYGHEVADFHHFYLPAAGQAMGEVQKGEKLIKPAGDDSLQTAEKALRWYEKEDLGIFFGDDRFGEALSFIPESPDMLALTWEENGEILGMAGASADADNLWQIGINVLPGGEHRGMGTLLVTRLKEEILKRGRVPFYGTAESHIRSQRVAVQSGFVPAWAELYTKRI